jgi:hypothetical protein
MKLKKSAVVIGKYSCTVIQFNYSLPKKAMQISCQGKAILHLTGRTSSLSKHALQTEITEKSINRFFIVSHTKEEFDFIINGEAYKSSKIKSKLTEKNIESLLFTMAYEEYYKGNSELALDILINSLGDKYLARTVLNAFTFKERQSCTELLWKAAHNRKLKLSSRYWVYARFLEGNLDGEELIGEEVCLASLLEVFDKNGDKYIPIPMERYKRIGKKIKDNYNVFTADKSYKLQANFKDLVFNKERLNISIRYEIPGFVKVNPRQARSVGFSSNVFKAKIFREQTIIKDGDINVDKFKVLASKETLKYLQGLEVRGLVNILEDNEYLYKDYTLIELDVSKIPVLNRSYIIKSDSLSNILDLCRGQVEAEIKQKTLKFFVSKLRCSSTKGIRYSAEQVKLLSDYGLDHSGVYRGVDNVLQDEVNENQHLWRIFEFYLKGFSKLPKVESVIKKLQEGSESFNGPEKIMAEYINYLRHCKYDTCSVKLSKLLEEQKAVIRNSTRCLAMIKLAKTLTGGWWKEIKEDSSGKYTYNEGNSTLVLKVIRKMLENR